MKGSAISLHGVIAFENAFDKPSKYMTVDKSSTPKILLAVYRFFHYIKERSVEREFYQLTGNKVEFKRIVNEMWFFRTTRLLKDDFLNYYGVRPYPFNSKQ
jgi:hypothetical protein